MDFGTALLDTQGTCPPTLSESRSEKSRLLHATAVSEKENLQKLGYNNRIEIIPNGIEVDKISLKNNWERKKKILFLSRIHIKKGIEYLLEAATVLKDKLEGYVIELQEKVKRIHSPTKTKTKNYRLNLWYDSMVEYMETRNGNYFKKQMYLYCPLSQKTLEL